VSAHPTGPMHLVPLDDALDEMRRYGAYLALWSAGAGREAAAGECPEGCECDCYLYCPQCLREAAAEVNGQADGAGAAR